MQKVVKLICECHCSLFKIICESEPLLNRNHELQWMNCARCLVAYFTLRYLWRYAYFSETKSAECRVDESGRLVEHCFRKMRAISEKVNQSSNFVSGMRIRLFYIIIRIHCMVLGWWMWGSISNFLAKLRLHFTSVHFFSRTYPIQWFKTFNYVIQVLSICCLLSKHQNLVQEFLTDDVRAMQRYALTPWIHSKHWAETENFAFTFFPSWRRDDRVGLWKRGWWNFITIQILRETEKWYEWR